MLWVERKIVGHKFQSFIYESKAPSAEQIEKAFSSNTNQLILPAYPESILAELQSKKFHVLCNTKRWVCPKCGIIVLYNADYFHEDDVAYGHMLRSHKKELGLSGSNSTVERQPSKLNVAGSIPVSRSNTGLKWKKSHLFAGTQEFG